MKLNNKLNLVVEGQTETGTVYFHSVPIRREVFEEFSRVIAMTFSELSMDEIGMVGATVAAIRMKEIAIRAGLWEDQKDLKGNIIKAGVKNGLMEEIARLTNILYLGSDGWETCDVNTAVNRGFVDEETWEEAKQRIVFFTLLCYMPPAQMRKHYIGIFNVTWETQTTASNCSEYADGLRTSSETEDTTKTIS